MHKAIDPDRLSPQERHKMAIGTVVPRPIAWVTSLDDEDRLNLAPFSYFMGCHSYLPAIAVSIGSRGGSPKDSRANIRARGEFVVNMVTEDLAERMNITGAAFPAGVNEADVVGLATLPSAKVAPPRISASPIHLECRVLHAIDLDDDPLQSTLFVAQVVMWHVRDDLVDDAYHVDQAALHLIARMGGPFYARAFELFRMDIPDWRAVGAEPG